MSITSTVPVTRGSMLWVVILASVGAFITSLDAVVVSTALPSLRADFGASLSDLEWTVNGYPSRAVRKDARCPMNAARTRLIASLLAVPLAASLPFWLIKTNYLMSIVTIALVWICVGTGWNILAGFGGQLSLGHAVFFGEGAYGVYLLHVKAGINPWIDLILVGLIGFVTAIPFVVVFRLRGAYFALVTFAIVTVVLELAGTLTSVTNGPDGVSVPLVNGGDSPGVMQFANPRYYYFLLLALAICYFCVAAGILRSRLGLQLRAVRDDEVAAMASGVRPLRVKTIALCISAFMTAVAGALYMRLCSSSTPKRRLDTDS